MPLPATVDRLDSDLQQVSSSPQTLYSYRIRNYNDYTIRVKLYNRLVANVLPSTAPTVELDVPGFTEQIDTPGTVFNVAVAVRCVTGGANDDRVSPANPPQVELQFQPDGTQSAVNPQTGNYTLLVSDAGGTVVHTSGSPHTFTIPSNASVPFVVGTMATFINEGAGLLSIAINSDTLKRCDGTSGTGTRTLAADSTATAIKVSSTVWRINGLFAS
jgi:hypothetical protein